MRDEILSRINFCIFISHPVRHNLRLCYSRLIAGGIVDLQSKFVLIPLLELTRAVAQTVPDFFLILPFACGLHQCSGWVCQPETTLRVMLSEVETSQNQTLYSSAVFNLASFVVYLFSSLSLSTFCPQKVAKTPGTRVEQVTHSSAQKFCEYSSFVARLPLVSAVPISGTKELASRTPGIVWHTRSDTFVLIPQLELTHAVAQTVPDFFLILPFVGGFHKQK